MPAKVRVNRGIGTVYQEIIKSVHRLHQSLTSFECRLFVVPWVNKKSPCFHEQGSGNSTVKDVSLSVWYVDSPMADYLCCCRTEGAARAPVL